jgi:hypothetical protein
MGNCCLRQVEENMAEMAYCKQEGVICKVEFTTPFATVKLNTLEKCLENHNFDHRLNKSDIRKVLGDLGLNQNMLTDPETPQFRYFEKFLDKDKLYTQRKLILSAILISTESTDIKVDLLGKYYDFSKNQALEKDEINTLLNEIVEGSVQIIPLIAVKEEEDEKLRSSSLSEAEYENYISYLLLSKDLFTEKYSKAIMGASDSLRFTDLIIKFRNNALAVLLSSKVVRNILFDLSKTIKEYN